MSLELITLIVTFRSGNTASAHYQRREDDGPWKLSHADSELEFLRYCSASDAREALEKRGWTCKWVNRREKLDRFEEQGYSHFKPGHYAHARKRASSHGRGKFS